MLLNKKMARLIIMHALPFCRFRQYFAVYNEKMDQILQYNCGKCDSDCLTVDMNFHHGFILRKINMQEEQSRIGVCLLKLSPLFAFSISQKHACMKPSD